MASVTVTVEDASTKAPIPNAHVQLVCTFPPGGTVPEDGYTDNNGVAIITFDDSLLPVIGWQVTASAYQTGTGTGTPPATILLTATAPPATHVLTVNSNPAGITFTINNTTQTTPYADTLQEGSYTITMPQSVVVNGKTYTFQQWEDGTTVSQRTINLTADMTVQATYAAKVSPCERQFGDWGILNPIRDFFCWIGGISTT
jgi:hypothetical protein